MSLSYLRALWRAPCCRTIQKDAHRITVHRHETPYTIFHRSNSKKLQPSSTWASQCLDYQLFRSASALLVMQSFFLISWFSSTALAPVWVFRALRLFHACLPAVAVIERLAVPLGYPAVCAVSVMLASTHALHVAATIGRSGLFTAAILTKSLSDL